jgi:hypothetical protein
MWNSTQRKALKLKCELVTVEVGQRESVEMAIRETCAFYLLLHAINVRTNHVHVVVTIGAIRPERDLNALKANATQGDCGRMAIGITNTVQWVDKGSKRYLWNERNMNAPLPLSPTDKVMELPEFD